MRYLILTLLVYASVSGAQVNTNSISVPNTGANTTAPPLNTYSTQGDNLSNPSNSTTPGANGSYTVDLSKPDMSVPITTPPPLNQGSSGINTYSPQGGNSGQNKKSKK